MFGIFSSVEDNFAEIEIEKWEPECKIILFSVLKFITNAMAKVTEYALITEYKITEQQKPNRASSDCVRRGLFLRRLKR
mgnify:CR=1 FL=1